MILKISKIQKFPIESDLVLIILTGGWDLKLLNNSSTPVFNFMKNSPQSVKFTYKLKPKSAYSTYVNNGYTNLKVRSSILLPAGDPSWLDIASDWSLANYTSLNQNQYKDVEIFISPPLTISQGKHLGKVGFQIEGTKNGTVEILSSYEIPVELVVFEEGYYYNPSQFTFYYKPGNTSVQQIQVGGDNWKLNIPKGLQISGTGVVQNPDGTSYSMGSGFKNFDLSLHSSILGIIGDSQSIILPVTIQYATGTFTVPVTVVQAGDYYPTATTFSIQNGQVDKSFQLIHLTRSDVFLVSAPANIGYEILNLPSGKKIKLFVIDPGAFGTGVFKLPFHINYPGAAHKVDITVAVGNQFDLGIDGSSAVFTKSMNDLMFTTSYEESFIDLTLLAVGASNGYNYKFPFFKKKARKNIGRSLENFISYDLNETLDGNYPMNYFNLTIDEKKDDIVLLNFTKMNVPFLKGFKPLVIENKAILQHNAISRVTKDSFALISVYSLNGSFEYFIKKNNVVVFTSALEFGYIRTLKISFKDYAATPGDTFSFVVKTFEGLLQKDFVIFPDPAQLIEVVYLDSFGLHACMSFTGNTKNVGFQITNRTELFNSQQFVHTRKYAQRDSTTLTLNTGFILQKQVRDLKELLLSPKAWIVLDGKKFLEIIPETEELMEMSNDNFTYSYNVNFKVNQSVYAQDYNF